MAAVVITERERFEPSVETLRNVVDTVDEGTPIVFVDGGSPPSIALELERVAAEHDVLLLRSEHFLVPNAARNLALPFVDADAIAFVDNDMRFEPGWLERLARCADETGAWLVSPIVTQEGNRGVAWHMVGGDAAIVDDGGRRFHEEHRLMGHEFDGVVDRARERIGFVEFHCVLVARPALDTCFPLDEELRSTRDHCDLSLDTAARGGEMWLEPSVITTQVYMPDRLPPADRRYYRLRWSDAWNRRSLERFREKWDLDPNDPLEHHDLVWLSAHRLYGNLAYGGVMGSMPSRIRRMLTRIVDRGEQAVLHAKRSTLRPPPPEVRIVHDASWRSDARATV
jgi:glycosyltransferase involved in cell wall biosynthesis